MNTIYYIEIKTDRFDQKSELPVHYNAGNRFYGKDVAEFIKDRLNLNTFKIIDEDWGWLVYGVIDGIQIKYCIGDWHDIDKRFGGIKEGDPTTVANWRIFIKTAKTIRFFGFIPVNRSVNCPIHLGEQLVELLKSVNIIVTDNGIE